VQRQNEIKPKCKRGQIGSLPNLVITLVIVGLVLFMGTVLIGQIFTVGTNTFSGNSQLTGNLTNIMGTLFTAFTTITNFLPIIVLAALGAVVLVIIFNLFGGGRSSYI
jgi:flagellar biosynthesis protein FlhB